MSTIAMRTPAKVQALRTVELDANDKGGATVFGPSRFVMTGIGWLVFAERQSDDPFGGDPRRN